MKHQKQLYKYTRILASGEEAIRFEMIEDNGERVMVMPVNLGLAIAPIENLSRDEVKPCEC